MGEAEILGANEPVGAAVEQERHRGVLLGRPDEEVVETVAVEVETRQGVTEPMTRPEVTGERRLVAIPQSRVRRVEPRRPDKDGTGRAFVQGAFDGRLPRWVGFDHGPIELPGSRATIVQSGIFKSHNRQTTFTPSWRFITDLGEDWALTALAGGPSGRRFSKWYKNDIDRWLNGDYKTLSANEDGSRE